MRLAPEQVAEVKASEGLYRAADLARAYDVNRSTIKRIWDGELHKDIRPADEPPNIETKKRLRDYADDIPVLRERGLSLDEIADHLGVGRSTIYAARGIWL